MGRDSSARREPDAENEGALTERRPGAGTRARPGSAQKVGNTRWRVRTTSGTSNREHLTPEADGTPRA